MKTEILAFLTAFVTCALLLKILLPLLKRKDAKQEILVYVKEHSHKSGTPTMGGIAFLLAGLFCVCLFVRGNAKLAILSAAITLGYGIVGFLDDFIKIYFKRNLGLRAYQKILIQLVIAVIVGVFVFRSPLIRSEFVIPFWNRTVQLGYWGIPLTIFIFLSCTNGVNLTDGIDGLATGVTLRYLLCFGVYVGVKISRFNSGGQILLAEEYTNVLILICIFSGALLAFRLFNCFPAKIFMGDTGSLALGGLVASISVFTKFGLFIPFLGIMFVVSCASVVIQVISFRFRKKRVFRMAPFHHHLQEKGMSETRIVVVYDTVTLLSGLLLGLFL